MHIRIKGVQNPDLHHFNVVSDRLSRLEVFTQMTTEGPKKSNRRNRGHKRLSD